MWPLCKSLFWEFSTIYWSEEQSYSKKCRPVEDFHTGTTNFTLTAGLPLWINLQFLKTSWKGVIFCHLKLWSVWKIKPNKIKHINSRKLCWLSRYMTTDLTMCLNVDMMDQTSNKMKYLSLYNTQQSWTLVQMSYSVNCYNVYSENLNAYNYHNWQLNTSFKKCKLEFKLSFADVILQME